MPREEESSRTVIGVLYPGEMGAALGRLLRENGYRVLTATAGRSVRTRERARRAGLEERESLDQVVREADLTLSLVHPAAALSLAEAAGQAAASSPRPRIYLDLNSVSPETARRACTAAAAGHLEFVDGAIHGLAARLEAMGTLYLSGPAAARVAPLFEPLLRVQVVGEVPGDASAMKMLLGGLSKGLSGLLLELGLLAAEAGLLAEAMGEYRHYYPGLMEAGERLLPTYPRHAARRAQELGELEAMARALSVAPAVIHGARQVVSRMGELEMDVEGRAPGTAAEVVEQFRAALGAAREEGERKTEYHG